MTNTLSAAIGWKGPVVLIALLAGLPAIVLCYLRFAHRPPRRHP